MTARAMFSASILTDAGTYLSPIVFFCAMEGYCVKCKKKVEIDGGEEVILDTKRGKTKFFMGPCPVCGTKVSRILGKA